MRRHTGRPNGVNRVQEESPAYGQWTATTVMMSGDELEVGERYMENLRKKALSVSQALREAGVPHAVIGGLAVAAHVARKDPMAQRNTQDLDILLRRADLESAKQAMVSLGYRFRKVVRLHAFMPKEPGHSFVEGVHVIWAGEKVRADYVLPAPNVEARETYLADDGVQYLGLRELLVMKLTSFRLKDQVHIQDLLAQRLITKDIEAKLPPELRARLRQVKQQTEREKLG